MMETQLYKHDCPDGNKILIKGPVYFISGHRDVTKDEFDKNYKPVIDKAILEINSTFVVGDYEGVDIMAQNYLVEKGCAYRTTVYHMFNKPRNCNPSILIRIGGFETDEERDAAMTKCSNSDIAFVRKGKWGSGTAQNIKRRHMLNTDNLVFLN